MHLAEAHLRRIECSSSKTSGLFVNLLDKNTTADISVADLTVNNPRLDKCLVQTIAKDVNRS